MGTEDQGGGKGEGDNKPNPLNDDGKGTKDDDSLREAGLKALREERSAREIAEKAARVAQTALDEFKKKHQTDEEKAIEEARKIGHSEGIAESRTKLVKAEILAAAAKQMANPEDAHRYFDDLSRFVRDGEPDSKAIKSAIDELVKSRPNLASKGTAGPLPGGGGKPATGVSINDFIRAKAGRG